MKPKITKVAVATLSAIALTSQLTAIPQTAVKAEVDFADSSYAQTAVAVSDCAISKYDKSQIELLIMQLIAGEKSSVAFYDISYEYNNLYYAPKEKAGYVVDFAYQGEVGYIIVLADEYALTPAEMVYGYHSPYYGKNGTYLYPGVGNYYILSKTGEITVATQVDRPQGGIENTSGLVEGKKPVTVKYGDYSRLVVGANYEIPDLFPSYRTSLVSEQHNNCANAAGVIALNCWNVRHDNDLLKLAIDKFRGPEYLFSMKDTTAREYMKKFYSYMNTNWIGGQYGGTLPKDCYNGFIRMIKEHGYEAYAVELENYDRIKSWIRQGDPVFFTYLYYAFSGTDKVEEIHSDDQSGTLSIDATLYNGIDNFHTFIGYGYVEYTIYDKNGKPQNIHLIKVADGWDGVQYLHYDRCTPLSAAVIHVYKYLLSGC